MDPNNIQLIGSILFGCAVLHTFFVSKFEHMAHKYPSGSMKENIFHFLAEVEVVFGFWAGILLIFYSVTNGFVVYDESHHAIGGTIKFLEDLNYTEPAFVFVIMCMAGTKPVLLLAEQIITLTAKLFPFSEKMSFYICALIFGPLLGSFITEPAAMTVTALILKAKFYDQGMSTKFKYATLGALFVNISIGGTLTNFAAPPVLMVAAKWHWDSWFMLTHFGYKAVIATIINASIITMMFRKELDGKLVEKSKNEEGKLTPPWPITLIHLVFMGLVVLTAHHMVFFLGLFLFFIGFADVTQEYQDKLKLKESLLVGFFLGGLVTLGNLQAWWLQPILTSMGNLPLYFGTTALTGITDNAALTYLGSLVELSNDAKYYLVAGAVIGGGLTVIANAPNPAGFGILKKSFGEDGISPVKLLLAALLPTSVPLVLFYFLPNLS
ncbi:putative Na+/H+ antiporter [Bacteriovoracaceae bacterium]|nr:putative Na+/H+ antiporter [Bacteriovoracaceae bacterium]